MTILATFRNTASSLLRNWRMLAVVGAVLILVLSTKRQWTAVRTISLGMVATGVALNLFVILANGGRMPAETDSIPAAQNDEYQAMDSRTRFAYLGDWIKAWDWLISPGDICLYIGLTAVLADRWIGRFLM